MIKRLFRVLGDFLRSDVWVINGIEASSRKPLKMIFAGSEIQKNYIAMLAYNSICRERSIGKKLFWDLYFFLKRGNERLDLAIVEGHLFHRIFYKNRNDFFIPLWLEGVAALPLIASNRSAKEDIRKIRKNKLDYVTTKAPEKLNEFYYKMYLPLVAQRHRDRTVAMDYLSMMNAVQNGVCELLLVKRDEDIIAGVLILTQEAIPRLWSNGICVQGENKPYNSSGAVAATYWFAGQYLSEAAYDNLHFGLSRGFLDDGVLRYKKKWGARFEAHGSRGFIVKPFNPSPGADSFFRNNPFIYLEKKMLYGAVFVGDDCQPSCDEYCEFRKRYYLNKLRELHVFRLRKADGKPEKIASF